MTQKATTWRPTSWDSPDDVAMTDGRGPEPTRPAPRRNRHTVARISHVFGELVLTAGVMLLLFVGYTLFWTGVETQQAQNSLKEELFAQWADPQPGAGLTPPTSEPVPGEPAPEAGLADVDLGEGIGVLRIPRFGDNYAWAVVEGVRTDDLKRGPGHYPGTAMPGEVGNFALAAHRATYGEPFAQVEEFELGDQVVVETATTWYTYTVFNIDFPVDVGATWSIEPSPFDLGAEPTRSLMTLTTCHPRWASTYRFLVFTELTEILPKSDGVVPSALQQAA